MGKMLLSFAIAALSVCIAGVSARGEDTAKLLAQLRSADEAARLARDRRAGRAVLGAPQCFGHHRRAGGPIGNRSSPCGPFDGSFGVELTGVEALAPLLADPDPRVRL